MDGLVIRLFSSKSFVHLATMLRACECVDFIVHFTLICQLNYDRRE